MLRLLGFRDVDKRGTTVLDLGFRVSGAERKEKGQDDLGGCQNYGPFLGTLNIRGRIILGNPKRDHNFDNHPFRVHTKRRWMKKILHLENPQCFIASHELRSIESCKI